MRQVPLPSSMFPKSYKKLISNFQDEFTIIFHLKKRHVSTTNGFNIAAAKLVEQI